MKKTIYYSFTLFIFLQLIRCANPSSPQGGPKDTIPPQLLLSIPENNSLNYKGNLITLEFDEFIEATKIRNNLIITPSTETKYQVNTKKNRLFLKLEESLEDSTTYSFNFFQSITDITERTPTENLILAFSTGPFIDSLSISGSVKDLLTDKFLKEIIVGLYIPTDSLDYTTTKPRYFFQTSEEGKFKINNIKSSSYRLFAFNDKNKNLLFDPSEESHSFLSDTIELIQNLDSITLRTISLDLTDFQLTNTRATADGFEVRYNKLITDYSLYPLDTLLDIYSKLKDDRQSILVYNSQFTTDSVGIIVQAYDTLRNQLADTVYAKFREQRKTPEFKYTIIPKDKGLFSDTLLGNIAFNKPIVQYNIYSLLFQADTLYKFHPDTIIYNWNKNLTSINYKIPYDWQSYSDTVYTIIDSTKPDSLKTSSRDSLPQNTSEQSSRVFSNVQFKIPKGTFISVEQDSIPEILLTYQKDKPKLGSTLILTYSDSIPINKIELIDSQFKTIKVLEPRKSKTYSNLPPGKYSVRLFIDDNQDGVWSLGNLNQNQEPETVYIHPDFTELRENWEVEITINL